jgi:hypothetical protein
MNATAARWVDALFPRVAVRQWVITVPWRRRRLLARRPDLLRGVLRVALGVIAAGYRARANAPEGQAGFATVVQRFGSALNANLHFHTLSPDGVFVRDRRGHRVFRAAPPSTRDVEALVAEVAEACERWLAAQGFADPDDEPEDPDDTPALLFAASAGGWSAATGRPVKRVQVLGGREVPMPPRCAGCDGYTLHGGVVVRAADRSGLERVARYVLRPPLAKERLALRDDGDVELGLKRAWSDGTRALILTPMELTERLCAVVPPPFSNQVLYHGVFAARHAWRKEIVPTKPPPERDHPRLTRTRIRVAGPPEPSRHVPWSEMLWRVFREDGWLCPECFRPMTLRTVVVAPTVAQKILAGLYATGPP